MRSKLIEMPDEIKAGADELARLKASQNSIYDILNTNESGSVKSKSRVNVVVILEHDEKLKGLLGFNTFTENIEIMKDVPDLNIYKGYMRDAYIGSLSIYIENKYRAVFSNEFIKSGVVEVASRNSFNPVKKMIERDEWDGTERVSSLFIDYLGAEDSVLNREIAKKFLVGAVARVYHPGIKFELMPVLIGSQGIGKSTLCRQLCPDYFLDNLPGLSNFNKDNQMLIKDNLIIEVAELSALSRTAVENTKAFISTQVDKYKAPYGSMIEEHPRRCVFIGTTNEYDFLRDKTGNRRFLPVECGKIQPSKDVFNLDDKTIHQLWAEAYELYNRGEKLYLDPDINKELVETQKNHTEVDNAESLLDEYLSMPVLLDWNDIPTKAKKKYFDEYRMNGNYTVQRIGDDKQRYIMYEVPMRDIAEIVFNLDASNVARLPRKVSNHINQIMDNRDDFKRVTNIKVNGKNQRGYRRILE